MLLSSSQIKQTKLQLLDRGSDKTVFKTQLYRFVDSEAFFLAALLPRSMAGLHFRVAFKKRLCLNSKIASQLTSLKKKV